MAMEIKAELRAELTKGIREEILALRAEVSHGPGSRSPSLTSTSDIRSMHTADDEPTSAATSASAAAAAVTMEDAVGNNCGGNNMRRSNETGKRRQVTSESATEGDEEPLLLEEKPQKSNLPLNVVDVKKRKT